MALPSASSMPLHPLSGNEAFGDFLFLHPTPRIACYMDEVPDAAVARAVLLDGYGVAVMRDCGWLFFGGFPQKLLSKWPAGTVHSSRRCWVSSFRILS